MKRKNLLETALSEEKNVTTVVENTVKADQKFLKRAKRDLEDEIEDLGVALETRLSQNTPLDKSVIENTYSNLLAKKELLKTYQAFEAEYVTEDKA